MRCVACDVILSDVELNRKSHDWIYCTTCRRRSDEVFCEDDKEYVCGEDCKIPLDGTPLQIDVSAYVFHPFDDGNIEDY